MAAVAIHIEMEILRSITVDGVRYLAGDVQSIPESWTAETRRELERRGDVQFKLGVSEWPDNLKFNQGVRTYRH
jgi:hypothetical protein